MLESQNETLYTFTPAESFLTSIWISIYFGVVLALPVIFWQVWQFFVPAVDKQHAKLIKYFVVLAWVLAVVGLVFGYYIVLPAALNFLLGFDSDTFSNNLQAKAFLTFCTHVELAMALVWELPLSSSRSRGSGSSRPTRCAGTGGSGTSSWSASRSRFPASIRSRCSSRRCRS